MTRVAFYKMHILILEFISPIYKMSIFFRVNLDHFLLHAESKSSSCMVD
jgi:hypothetical protein